MENEKNKDSSHDILYSGRTFSDGMQHSGSRRRN